MTKPAERSLTLLRLACGHNRRAHFTARDVERAKRHVRAGHGMPCPECRSAWVALVVVEVVAPGEVIR